MDLKAEKRTGVVLAGVTLLIILLLPLLFRELEPDYQAAYSLDPERKRRFAAKDEKTPELPNLPPSASASVDAGGAARRGLQVSAHRALPTMGRVAVGEGEKAAAPEPEKDASAPAERAAPRLVPTRGLASRGGSGPGPAVASRAPALEDARLGKPETAPAPQLALTPGSAGARLAQKMGLGDVPGLIAAAQDPAGRECAEVSARLKPKLATATAAHRSASSALEASGCGKDSCGLYADDCAEKERSPEESRVAARRCRCDRLACRAIETCRAVDELVCEQQTACSIGGASGCAGSGCQ